MEVVRIFKNQLTYCMLEKSKKKIMNTIMDP
jgi:hypothetical protein